MNPPQVRKAAVKVILAVVQARPDLLADTWAACGPQLVRRFKEREENVRLDVINCFGCILQASTNTNGSSSNGNGNGASSKAGRSSLAALESPKVVSSIVSACSVHLAGTSVKTKSAAFALLKALVSALNVRMLAYTKTLHVSNVQ